MFQVCNDSLNSWCYVYPLYMHCKIQYVNKNTSMPVTGKYIFSKSGECNVEEGVQTFLLFIVLVWSEC